MGTKQRLSASEGAIVNLAFALARARKRIRELESEIEDLRDESRVATEQLQARLAALEARPPQVLIPQGPYQRPHVPDRSGLCISESPGTGGI